MTDIEDLLGRTAAIAATYLAGVNDREVFPSTSSVDLSARLQVPLQDGPMDPLAVIEELSAGVDRGLVASAGGDTSALSRVGRCRRALRPTG